MGETVLFSDLHALHEEIRPSLDGVWAQLLATGDFVRGAAVAEFEAEWAAYCGTTYALGVGNGTDALHLALRALGITDGEEVIVPANTFVATVEAVLLAGAVPRFADVDPDTLLLNAETLQAALTTRTRAVIVVHLYGQMADMDAIGQVAREAGIDVVEDAAQAHGATWRGQRAGSFARIGCFSFYPGKNLGALGDAGAVVTSDPELAERVDLLRDHGRPKGLHYKHVTFGMNSRLDTLQAGVLSAKLRRLDEWTAARCTVANAYRSQLENSRARLVAAVPEASHVYHLVVVRVPQRDRVRAGLQQLGVTTGVHYPVPCHRNPPYQRYATGPLPVTERAAIEVLSLPMFPHLTSQQVEQVCQALDQVCDTVETSRVA